MPRDNAAIPRFYLFGEAPKDVDPDFLHLEEIRDRSAPLHGQIRPHTHTDLNHVFLITHGTGRVLNDETDLQFSGPHILFIPAGSVHGFAFSNDITGYVLTIATAHLKALFQTRTDVATGLDVQALAVPDRQTRDALKLWYQRLKRELQWDAPGHLAAIEANLLGLMTDVHRLAHRKIQTISTPASPHLRLVARFRELVEARYKMTEELSTYLKALCVSETQLRYACLKVGEKSPKQIILKRRLIEAKRLMLYSDLSIAACGQQIGFDDPAYFSRLFRRHTGQSPRDFRVGRGQF